MTGCLTDKTELLSPFCLLLQTQNSSEVTKVYQKKSTTILFIEVNSSSLLKEFTLTNEMKLLGTDYLEFS